MFAAVYTSRAQPAFDRSDLVGLLEQCRSKNVQVGVTGMLLYRGGDIIQLLEGNEETVRHLLERIREDSRHTRMSVLWTEVDRDERIFPEWSMGFRDLDDSPVELDGYTDIMNAPVTLAEVLREPTVGQELLGMFRRLR